MVTNSREPAPQITESWIAGVGPNRNTSGVPSARNTTEPKDTNDVSTPIFSAGTPTAAVSNGATTGSDWLMKLPAICIRDVRIRAASQGGVCARGVIRHHDARCRALWPTEC